jgi:aerobic-type carbon monoxide dehydrogenase small subunit (CoxS/CutS family)
MSHFYWNEQAIPYRDGETLALALRRAQVEDFGSAAGGQQGRYFCGIGQCQGCLVSVDGGAAVESCLTPARPNAVVTPGAF